MAVDFLRDFWWAGQDSQAMTSIRGAHVFPGVWRLAWYVFTGAHVFPGVRGLVGTAEGPSSRAPWRGITESMTQTISSFPCRVHYFAHNNVSKIAQTMKHYYALFVVQQHAAAIYLIYRMNEHHDETQRRI